MSRNPQNPLAAEEFGLRLRSLRNERGASHKTIERWLLINHGLEVSDESIRKAHAGLTDPEQCDLGLVLGLWAFYECAPSALGEFAARIILRARSLVLAAPGPDEPGTAVTGWYSDHIATVTDIGTKAITQPDAMKIPA